MANQILNFNGRTLYSNKAVRSITNSRVTFADGSWVDMSSGEKYVRGQDDIVIDPPFFGPSSVEKATIGPTIYDAFNLDIRNVPACVVVVQPHTENTVVVTISGNKPSVDSVTVKHEGDTVYVGGAEGPSIGSGINISGGSIHIGSVGRGNLMSNINIGGVSIVSGNVIIGGGSGGSQPQATITVSVPKGAKVNLNGDWYSANVGNTEGNLFINSTGSGDVQVGKVKNATVIIKGSSDVEIDEAQGNVSIRIIGAGDVRIKGGAIGSLNTDIIGSGDVTIRTEAEEADLNVVGAGDIYVSRVKKRPSKNVTGAGSIKVGNW
ncbi:hypothetical protein C5B42_03210 [Candidatus Cerribacteria bacterium 'Amazon FNV 2010 28 9']|uniref:Putative auto-transporter adhesin head GIN domain-containing protein n=1 Tax=Candidatus Cerribacteria bacterium 'Amazon FNV 2010 28 9' TaxID=2081795 RepID=A0A317JPX2_9BACT|nr:MAG: hypothetical protein C5B42_03210 [Candidatus Cerribacteria bacterium 'Amazon FNV 2010 28 9']